MRVFLTVVLPLLTPSLLYVIWLLIRARLVASAGGGAPITTASQGPDQAGDRGGAPAPHFLGDDVPWVTLTLSGALLAVAATMAMYLMQPVGSPNSDYIPPRYEDGQIIPSQTVPRGEDIDTAPAQ